VMSGLSKILNYLFASTFFSFIKFCLLFSKIKDSLVSRS